MAATPDSIVSQIGEAAGTIWHVLEKHGAMSLAKLTKQAGVSRDMTMQGVGWLAREGKVEITETKRGRLISLR